MPELTDDATYSKSTAPVVVKNDIPYLNWWCSSWAVKHSSIFWM